MSNVDESASLETQVNQRKAALIAQIVEHQKDSSRAGAAESIDRLKARLAVLAHIVKEGVVDGWGAIGPKARTRLEEWMAK